VVQPKHLARPLPLDFYGEETEMVPSLGLSLLTAIGLGVCLVWLSL
jgi:hypothetical protein